MLPRRRSNRLPATLVRKKEKFNQDGFVAFPDILDAIQCDALACNVRALEKAVGKPRSLLDQQWCMELAHLLRWNEMLQNMMQRDAVAVQCTLFDKTPKKNWLVSLHQDLSIPVKDRVDSPECYGWSEKEGSGVCAASC